MHKCSNAIAPLVALWMQYRTGQADGVDTGANEMGILMFGVAAMLLGLWIMGHKVIETIGSDITSVNAAR